MDDVISPHGDGALCLQSICDGTCAPRGSFRDSIPGGNSDPHAIQNPDGGTDATRPVD